MRQAAYNRQMDDRQNQRANYLAANAPQNRLSQSNQRAVPPSFFQGVEIETLTRGPNGIVLIEPASLPRATSKPMRRCQSCGFEREAYSDKVDLAPKTCGVCDR